MFKKHTYSPNHKVVSGPHNFSMPAGGGPAGAPGGGMDASGGAAANYADGGGVAEMASRVADKILNSDAQQYADKNTPKKFAFGASKETADANPGVGRGGEEQENAITDYVDRAAGSGSGK